jgi:hypothetical protein
MNWFTIIMLALSAALLVAGASLLLSAGGSYTSGIGVGMGQGALLGSLVCAVIGLVCWRDLRRYLLWQLEALLKKIQ